jgi:hypothetical protein
MVMAANRLRYHLVSRMWSVCLGEAMTGPWDKVMKPKTTASVARKRVLAV